MRNMNYLLTRDTIMCLNKKEDYRGQDKNPIDNFGNVAFLPLAFFLDTCLLPFSLIASLIAKKDVNEKENGK